MGDHVYICYCREDNEFVLSLATNLRSRGVPVWLDQWNIPSGADWDLTIDNALYDCARFLIILSTTSVESREVRAELRTALDENKLIVPILYQSCRIPRQLRLIQYIDFTSALPDDLAALNDVLVALGKAESTISDPSEISAPKKKISVPKKKRPVSAKAWNNKGFTLGRKGKYDEAIKAWDEAIKLNPNYGTPWYNKGEALRKQRKFDEAIKAYDRAILLNPDDDEARNARQAAALGYKD